MNPAQLETWKSMGRMRHEYPRTLPRVWSEAYAVWWPDLPERVLSDVFAGDSDEWCGNVQWMEAEFNSFALSARAVLQTGKSFQSLCDLGYEPRKIAADLYQTQADLKRKAELYKAYTVLSEAALRKIVVYGVGAGILTMRDICAATDGEKALLRILMPGGRFERALGRLEHMVKSREAPCLWSVLFVLCRFLGHPVDADACNRLTGSLSYAFVGDQLSETEAATLTQPLLGRQVTLQNAEQLARDAIDYVEGKRQTVATPPATVSTVGSSP